MPWEHCGHDVMDDQPCPGCGLTKDEWTVNLEVTRTFKVTRRQNLRVVLYAEGEADEPVPGEAYRVETLEGEAAGDGQLDDEGEARVGSLESAEVVLLFPDRTHADMHVETASARVVSGRDCAAFQLRVGRRYEFRLGQLPWLITLDPEEDEEHVTALCLEGLEDSSYSEVALRNHALLVEDRLEFRFAAGEPGHYALSTELAEHTYPVLHGLAMPSGRLDPADDEGEAHTLEDEELHPATRMAPPEEGAHDVPAVCGHEGDEDGEPRVEFLEIEDVTFHTNSAVFLALPPEADEEQEGEGASEEQPEGAAVGLDAIAAVLRYVERFPERRMLVVGHADASGQDAHNLTLSRERAQGVLAFLQGERDAWADVCEARNVPADLQHMLKLVAQARAWPCDPGPVDGEIGPLTRGALGRFRARLEDPEGGRDDDPPEGPEELSGDEWRAVYDACDERLRQVLGCSDEVRDELRGRLSFLDPAAVGCGEGIPARFWDARREGEAPPEQQDGSRERADRRVELLLFEPGEEPDLSCFSDSGYDRDACELYGSERYRSAPVPTGDDGAFRIELRNEQGQPIPEARYVAKLDDGTEVHGRLGLDGRARLLHPTGEQIVVSYPEPDDLLAKAEAGRARKAIDDQDALALLDAFDMGPETCQQVLSAYETYFNTASGEGLVADVEATFSGEAGEKILRFLGSVGIEVPESARLTASES